MMLRLEKRWSNIGVDYNHSVDIYGTIMWLFVLNHLKKIYSDRDMVDLR